MISTTDSINFELVVMEIMNQYKDRITTATDVETFSDELHQHIEIAIQDMLEDIEGFNGINPDDYNAQY